MKTVRCVTIAVAVVAAILLAACAEKEQAEVGVSSAPAAAAVEPSGAIAQKLCPVMGEPIDTSISVDHEGRRVYFCCQMCVTKFKENPDEYIAKLGAQVPVHHAAPEDGHGQGHEH